MSDGPDQPVEQPATPEPTVVVGYQSLSTPAAAPTSSGALGMAALRRQVSLVKYLLFACLALLVVLIFALGVALSAGQDELDRLSAQVAEMGDKAAAAVAAQPTSAPPAPAPATPGAQAVTQLGPAPTLTGAEIPAGADEGGAILVGDPNATDVVEVYIDYQCPYCQRWEQSIGEALAQRAMQPGSGLLLKQYNLAFLGETSPDLSPAGASARAASAAACVLDVDGVETFVAFSRAVFAAADPSEPPGQFTAKVLSGLAKESGASSESVSCIEEERHVPFVSATTKAGFGRGVGGTPTVLLNGETLGNPFSDPRLTALATTG